MVTPAAAIVTVSMAVTAVAATAVCRAGGVDAETIGDGLEDGHERRGWGVWG